MVLDVMRAGPVIAVMVIEDPSVAVPLAKALLAGGVRVLEVTLRTPGALDAIAAIAREVDDAIVGVGTISRPEHFAMAQEAGAKFGVCPGLTQALLDAARKSSLSLLPGTMTPSEVMTAREAGFSQMKLFPAQQAGGVEMLKALGSVFPDVTFCPTGGITADNAAEYLALPNVACVGGSWIAPKDLVAKKDWGRISQLAREATALRPRLA